MLFDRYGSDSAAGGGYWYFRTWEKAELLKIYSEYRIRSPGRLGAPRSLPSMLREQHAVPVESVRNSVLTKGHPVSCCIDSNDRLSVLLLEIR